MDGTEAAHGWLRDARAITVLTGAGISTDSGIPDFRGPDGLWTKDPSLQRLFTFDAYVGDPDVRRRSWQGRRHHAAWAAQPNAAHRALVDLERSGRVHTLVTQNIDGLHQAAGSDPARVLEVHGTLHRVECLRCGRETPMGDALARIDAGEDDPACLVCGGILKSATVSFGQPLRVEVIAAAVRAARECDLFLAIGTSLQVQPVAGLVEIAAGAGARVVIVNRDPTPYDAMAHALLRDPISSVVPRLVAGVAA